MKTINHQTSIYYYTAIFIILGILAHFLFPHSASALTYRQNTNLEFIFNSAISLSISGDLTIDDLAPSATSDSNVITVSVMSNAVAGYSLYTNVGNSTHSNPSYDNTNLNHVNGVNTFASLSASDSLSNMNDADTTTNGKWGYSYSLDAGNSWSNYTGLPIHSAGNDALLTSNPTPGVADLKFKIGAKANPAQISGAYSNVINFTSVANPNPPAIYMQNATLADCGNPMVDIRDYNTYTTTKIGGRCWMTQNLLITGTISAEYSNFVGEDVNISSGDLTSGDSYSEARTRTGADTNGDATTWYNYCAASAGTICTNSSLVEATGDICPANWHLPSGPSTVVDTDVNALIGDTASGWHEITANLLAFSPVTGGYYDEGTITEAMRGTWWTTSAADNQYRYTPQYNSNYNRFNGDTAHRRYNGLYIRCVLNR